MPRSSKYTKVIELDSAFIRQRTDGIIHVHYKKNTTLDVALQNQMRQIFIELTGGVRSKFIFSAEDGFTITPEAKKNVPKSNKDSPIEYYALIINNLAYRLIANFYFKVIRPRGNYKFFENLPDAVRWLQSVDSDPAPSGRGPVTR